MNNKYKIYIDKILILKLFKVCCTLIWFYINLDIFSQVKLMLQKISHLIGVEIIIYEKSTSLQQRKSQEKRIFITYFYLSNKSIIIDQYIYIIYIHFDSCMSSGS